MADYVLAHDLGTTGNKATLYDGEGRLVGSALVSYDTAYAQPRWAEQDPSDWWRAVCQSTQQLVAGTKIGANQIACVTFSGQMMGCVPLDGKAQPLRSAIIWADQRAVDEAEWLGQRVPLDQVYRITGHRLSASYSLAKILWLRDHQPEVYARTAKFVQAKDAIVARLTGQFCTDPSDASGTNLYDLQAGAWSQTLLDASEMDPNKLPEIYPSSAVVGAIRPEVAPEVGLLAGTPVVLGGGDGACAAAGAGVVRPGSAYNYVGSSSWIAMASKAPIFDPDYRTFTFGHLMPHTFMPTGTMQAAGASYQWTRDQLGQIEIQAARQLDISPYELLDAVAETSPPGAQGLLFLPYLLGERSPRWNPNARGAFVGLSVRHRRADMVRAVLEGITLNLGVILRAFQDQGAGITAMRLIGGGARGRLWNRIMAGVYGLPVQRLAILEEATSMGAALAGGVGVGLYPDWSMGERMNPIVETVEPEPREQALYERLAPVFDAAYEALAPVYEQLAAL